MAAARDHLVDRSRIIDHFLHFAFRFHSRVGRVDFSPQPVGRSVQVAQRIVERVLFGARFGLLCMVAFFRDVLPCAWAAFGIS